MFEKVVCVTLERRPDRWQKFQDTLPELPFKTPEKYLAVDGKKCPPPTWWKQGGGAWGCYKSHLNIIEDCLKKGVESVLLLEDDANFCEGFTEKYTQFVKHLPKDWGVLYLGGQHLWMKVHPPTRINEWVYRPYNVNRTHAWALRMPTMRDIYLHLCETKNWRRSFHIDHHLGTLCQRKKHPIYCPKEWLVGQAENKSDINPRKFPERFFPPAEKFATKFATPFVVVIGLHRSGSSLLAGMLHKMGVHMGNKFIGCEFNGGHEAQTLARISEKMLPYPGVEFKMGGDEFTQRFRRWALARTREAKKQGNIAGCKYPHNCALAPFMKDALGDSMLVVHIDRPLEKSIKSLIRRDGKRRDVEKLKRVQTFLWEEKQKFLSTHPHITVDYESLLGGPQKEVDRLIDYLSLHPSDTKRAAAVNLVDPEKRHII